MCRLSGCKWVVEARGYSFDLFFSISEVNVFALSANGRILPFFVCSWAVQVHTIFVEVVWEAVSEFS